MNIKYAGNPLNFPSLNITLLMTNSLCKWCKYHHFQHKYTTPYLLWKPTVNVVQIQRLFWPELTICHIILHKRKKHGNIQCFLMLFYLKCTSFYSKIRKSWRDMERDMQRFVPIQHRNISSLLSFLSQSLFLKSKKLDIFS